MTVEGHRRLTNCDDNEEEDIYVKGFFLNITK